MVETPALLAEANAVMQVVGANSTGGWTGWTNSSFNFGMNV